MLESSAELVIIGGGVVGVSTAYHLAKRGFKNIVLLEREQFFGQGSTGRSAGGFRHQFSTDINIKLSLKSIAMLEKFEVDIGYPIDFRQCGYLFIISNTDELEIFRQSIVCQHRHGVLTELWMPDQIAQRVPLLNMEGIIAGAYYGRDGVADPSGVVAGYVAAAHALGANLRTGIDVLNIRCTQSSTFAIQTNVGDIDTQRVVIAAGAWSAHLGQMVGIDLPIHPERQQILVTTPIPNLPNDFPMVIDLSQRLNLVREGQGILTGLSMTGHLPTFDTFIDADWTLENMERAMHRLPILASAGKLTEWAGLYEVTPDAHPIISPIAALPGLYVAAGFSGHGFMHGPIAGLLVSEQILDSAAHTIDIAGLRAERFAEGRLIKEFNVA